jgi:hypothetical protein
MAHRALGDAKLGGGVREADVPGSGLEGLERIELGQAARHGPVMRSDHEKNSRTIAPQLTKIYAVLAPSLEIFRQAREIMLCRRPGK